MIRLMPEFGGEQNPEERAEEILAQNEKEAWGIAVCNHLSFAMNESVDAFFHDEKGVDHYHVIKLSPVSFAIFDLKSGKDYAITERGDIIPSMMSFKSDEKPSREEVMQDIRELSNLKKRESLL